MIFIILDGWMEFIPLKSSLLCPLLANIFVRVNELRMLYNNRMSP